MSDPMRNVPPAIQIIPAPEGLSVSWDCEVRMAIASLQLAEGVAPVLLVWNIGVDLIRHSGADYSLSAILAKIAQQFPQVQAWIGRQ